MESDPGKTSPLPPAFVEYAREDYLLNGFRIRVLVGDSQLAAEIFPRLESLHTSGPGEPDLAFKVWSGHGLNFLARDSLANGSQVVARAANPNAIRSMLLQEIVRGTEQGSDWLAILHAGACGTDTSCVLLPGQSYAGKTTLCAALMASGLKFYCDDSAPLGNDGAVSPMPFGLMLREGSWNVLHSSFPEIIASSVFRRFGQKVRFLNPRPEQIAGSSGLAKSLVFVSFSPNESITLKPLLPFETLLKLQESGFWVKHDRQSIERFLGWLQPLPSFSLLYSGLREAVATIREIAHR